VTHIANRSWVRRGVFAALVLLAVSMGAPGAGAAPVAGLASAPALLEPKALELLKAASARLAGSHSMSFTATVSYESPSALGPALVYSTQSEVTMQRPDRLRVITPGDGPATEFYYDGKTMTAYGRAENLVATAAAPSTIDAALEQAFSNAAIYFPFTDLIVADPYKDLAEGLKVAFYTWPRGSRWRSILGAHQWLTARPRTWWHSATTVSLRRSGSASTTSCRASSGLST